MARNESPFYQLNDQLHLPFHGPPQTPRRPPSPPPRILADNCHRCGDCHMTRADVTRCAQANSQSDRNGSH